MGQPAINYSALEAERSHELRDELEKRLEAKKMEFSSGSSLKKMVLESVVGGSYEIAMDELENYFEHQKDYPSFISRAHRYLDHCKDLIKAVETKRNFPGMTSLPLAKQQELHERVLDHFEELKSYLKQIEQVERDVKLADVRSTVWFVKTVINCAFFVLIVGFALELHNGLAESFNTVLSLIVNDLTDLLFSIF